MLSSSGLPVSVCSVGDVSLEPGYLASCQPKGLSYFNPTFRQKCPPCHR